MNAGGDDGGAQLAVAEGVVPHEACVGETTNESRDNSGGLELPPQRGKSETESDCGTSAYSDEGGRSTRAPTRTRKRRTGQREASCDEEKGTEPFLSERRL